MSIITAALVGYLTALSGFFAGALLSRLVMPDASHPVQWRRRTLRESAGALILGVSSGLLTAFICFDLLPPVFVQWGLYKGLAALLAGTLCAALMTRKHGHPSDAPAAALTASKQETIPYAPAAALVAGVMLHNLPEGVALGAMLKNTASAGLFMALLLAVHCLPEALMVFLSAKKPLRLCFLLALPMSLGSALGFLFGGTVLPAELFLAFAAGLMLYIACGEILPDGGEKKQLKGWGAVLGFALGIGIVTWLL